MIRHTLLLIYRNFRRYRSTFFINVIGLSSGLASALLIYLWVADEWNIDKFHANNEQLFRVMINNANSQGIETSPSTQVILGDALHEEIPEIDNEVTTLGGTVDITFTFDNRHVSQTGIMAGPDFFNVFSFELIAGAKDGVLTDKRYGVISESMAVALFGDALSAVGKTIEWEFAYGKGQMIVSGVFRNIDDNSSLRFDFLFHLDIYKELVGKESLHWGNFGCNTFITLKEGTDMAEVSEKISGFVKSKDENSRVTLFLMPYSSYYLYGNFVEGKQIGGRIEYVRLFSLIGIFILIVACINFMNLSTAKATTKIREVGIKKAIGARRTTLTCQYLAESLLLSFISVLIALLITDLLIPKFNVITGKNLMLVFDKRLVMVTVIITLVTGLVAGTYPAFYLSGFSPTQVLKGKVNLRSASFFEMFARKGLIVFQFSLSIVFIVAVGIIYKQIEFLQSKNLGYDKDHLLSIKPQGAMIGSMDAFIWELKKLPGVVNASSISRTIVGSHASTEGSFNWEGKDPDAIVSFEIVNGNYDLIETLGINMKEGRSFSREFAIDSSSIILNEAAIAVMGLKEPVGKTFNLWGKEHTIIGITEDFHFESLRHKVNPLFFRLIPSDAEQVLIRFSPGDEHKTVATLESAYKAFNPGYNFEYTFLNREYEAQYDSEKRVEALSRYFAVLAIVISCLGLFGLASFTAERRLKEIGIRKVLGSGEWRIIYLLSSDFTNMVLLACVIALPLSYYGAIGWLSGFAYKTPLYWWYFPAAGFIALFIAWLTVGVQALRAARINPSQCLKEE